MPHEKRHQFFSRHSVYEKNSDLHRRLERWIHLNQFLFELPSEYRYAARVSRKNTNESERGIVKGEIYLQAGWMAWFGSAQHKSRDKCIATSLLRAKQVVSIYGKVRLFLKELWRAAN